MKKNVFLFLLLFCFFLFFSSFFVADDVLAIPTGMGTGKSAELKTECQIDSDCNDPNKYCSASKQCYQKEKEGIKCNTDNECQSNSCQTMAGGKEKKCINPATGEGTLKIQPFAPALEINIPTLQPFTTSGMQKADEEGFIYVPFIGQYIAAIFRWALLVAGIVAVVLVIWGGFVYLTSGGNASRASEGKDRITHAILGLIILLGSYTILYIINPGLVEFRSLRIKVIEPDILNNLVFDEDLTPQTGNAKPFGTTEYDKTFQDFAQCVGLNWQIYKQIAHHESGLNPQAKNPQSSATGLFQTLAGKDNATCKAVLKKIKWDDKCDSPGLTDPQVNTAYATRLFKVNAERIKKECGDADFKDKIFMIYFGNGGPGYLQEAIKKFGCNPYTKENSWPPDGTFPEKYAGTKIFIGAPSEYVKKIVKEAEANGITTFDGPQNPSQCPIK